MRLRLVKRQTKDLSANTTATTTVEKTISKRHPPKSCNQELGNNLRSECSATTIDAPLKLPLRRLLTYFLCVDDSHSQAFYELRVVE